MYFYLAFTFPLLPLSPRDSQFNALVFASFGSLSPPLSQPGVQQQLQERSPGAQEHSVLPFLASGQSLSVPATV